MQPSDATVRRDTNFGRNQSWETRIYEPANEHEVLAILDMHSKKTIRAFGSKHSWSDIVGAEISLDMTRFASVEPFVRGGKKFVRVGAGCTLRKILRELHAKTDQTLPTLGAVDVQTISGAISTGTHGSGRPSLSSYVTRVKVAAYDEAGNAVIYDYAAGQELEAARCGLGCLGIIIEVELSTTPKYMIAETVRLRTSLEDALSVYPDYPLTQLLWSRHNWKWLAFQRKPIGPRTLGVMERLKTRFLRVFSFINVDVMFHVGVTGSRSAGAWAVRGFQWLMPSLVPKGVERIDDSERILAFHHDLFRHEEMEIFVEEAKLAETTELLRAITDVFAGNVDELSPSIRQIFDELGCYGELLANRGRYVLHYPFIVRRVPPDDSLISMTASKTEASFSISAFTYDPPARRKPFYDFCSFVARALVLQVEARFHWGKHFPLNYEQISELYPKFERFREIALRSDPHGVFRNGYTARVLNLPPRGATTSSG
ncbi:D-arabinono-1,4-lactone oxidase [Bradyrhizobium vignae]|uniref:Putative FAD-dependent oxidoreductase n=1 Tax=Bradyrhizobium vignae TaxID=1549949 RepID=A0A2U3PUI8_9BRAD|nr:D-arabinono-1,4-lactone oxidase [Bradyrhizobium vignae]SPP92827.1 putative FAD-dependent oxidoreductase [Bradyrhizobium vignae]